MYVFLKLLADGKLYAADASLNKTQTYYPVIEILRRGTTGNLGYVRDGTVKVVDKNTDTTVLNIPTSCFRYYAGLLISAIKNAEGPSFAVSNVEKFLSKICYGNMKAKSDSKYDIVVKAHDPKTASDQEFKFSIKSRLGKPSTLLNASRATNFIYAVKDIRLTCQDIDDINEKTKLLRDRIRKRIAAVESRGGKLEFKDTQNKVFKRNMQVIDSCLPRIIAEILLEYYITGQSDMLKLLSHITTKNPCNYNGTSEYPFYEHKVKAFLRSVALGMTPAKAWDVREVATGGYIIVKEDGEVLCYHIYNRNDFEDYLLKNTRLETPSTRKHGFGELYRDDSGCSIKLNLQIRFKKKQIRFKK